MFLRWLLAGVLLALACNAFADTWGTLNCCSYHTERPTRFNERNQGFGFETDVAKDWRAIGGLYENSIGDTSLYAGVMWNAVQWGYLRINVMGGLFTGYGHAVVPVVAPVISLEGKMVGVNVLALPPVGDHQGIFALQLKVKF